MRLAWTPCGVGTSSILFPLPLFRVTCGHRLPLLSNLFCTRTASTARRFASCSTHHLYTEFNTISYSTHTHAHAHTHAHTCAHTHTLVGIHVMGLSSAFQVTVSVCPSVSGLPALFRGGKLAIEPELPPAQTTLRSDGLRTSFGMWGEGGRGQRSAWAAVTISLRPTGFSSPTFC